MTSEKLLAPELIYYCEFDPERWDERLEITFSNEHIVSLELTSPNRWEIEIDIDIKDKKPLISKSFFGENILNVTTIAGRNGSGKSHILRKIYSVPKELKERISIKARAESIHHNINILCIYSDGEDYVLEKSEGRINVTSKNIDFKNLNDICRLFFYNLEVMHIAKLDSEVKSVNKRTLMQTKSLANLYELLIDENNILSNNFKKAFFIPKKIDITILFLDQSFNNIKNLLNSKEQLNEYVKYIHNHSSEKEYIFPIAIILHIINNTLSIVTHYNDEEEHSRSSKMGKIVKKIQVFFEEQTYKKKNLEKILREQQEWIIEKYSMHEQEGVGSSVYWQKCLKYLTQYFLEFELNPVMQNLTPSSQKIIADKFDENFYFFLKGYEYYKTLLSESIDISFGRFSSGQESILFQASSIVHHINHELRLSEEGCNDKKTLVLFIDEYEQYLHPEWARIYLNYLIELLQGIYSKKSHIFFQIILTTHSPYLISDLPKENIRLIFKETDKEGDKTEKRIVKVPERSFASNYYDILNDSFFLEDTIGEFAKQKINGWIKELNNLEKISTSDQGKLSRIDEIKELIKIIDDQFIRSKLLELATDVRNKIEKKDDKDLQKYLLDKKIEELQQQRAILDQEDYYD